jgi:hypothetical protein
VGDLPFFAVVLRLLCVCERHGKKEKQHIYILLVLTLLSKHKQYSAQIIKTLSSSRRA